MACFTLVTLENLIIDVIILVAVVAIIRLLVPWVMSLMGTTVDARVLQIINIVVWAIVAVFLVRIIFLLLACLR